MMVMTMISKDQAIGWIILIACIATAISYSILLFWPPMREVFWFWLIAIPVWIALMAVLAIGAWIGWTMATTPPPKPIEEIEAEIEKEGKEAEGGS